VDHYGRGIVIHKFDTSEAYSISKGKLTRLPSSSAPATNPPKP
jgi:hypothetical protein